MATHETDIPAPADAAPARPERDPSWDYLRAAATAAIVLIHVVAYALGVNYGHVERYLLPRYNELLAFGQTLRWAVPAFALLTGALVWGRKWDGGPGAYRAFLVRRAVVVAVPYLFWVAVYYLLRPSVLGVPWPSGGVLAVVGDSLGRAIDGSAWYHLYFVPMVLVLYVLTPLASRVAHWSPEALVAGMVALAVAWLAFVGDASWAEGPFGNLVHTVVLYAPSAGLGAWLAVRGKPVRRVLVWVWPLLLAGGVYGMWVKGWDRLVYSGGIGPQLLGQLVVFAAVLGVYGLCLLVAGRWRPADRAAESLYATSFGIYLLHPLVLAGLGALVLLRVPARDLLFSRDLLFMWVVVLATTWGAVRLLLLGKWTRWAV